MKKITIEVRRRPNTIGSWIARIIQKGERRIRRETSQKLNWFNYGRITKEEAIGELISNHPKLFNIKIVENEDLEPE